MIKVRFSTEFKKQYKKCGRKMQKCVDERLAIFIDNPKDSILKDHGLIGDYLGYRSININGDWRAIYLETDKDEVIFEMLGTHSQLYK